MPGFFADECVGRAIVEGLVDRGLDVLDASVVCKGEDDERVLSLAAAAGRIVITSDWGFGEMTVRHGRPAVGVIILSLYALSADARERTAIEKIVEIADQVAGHLSVHHVMVAGFIEINARQSPRAELGRVSSTLEAAFIRERNMCCPHRTEEPDEHLAHALSNSGNFSRICHRANP